MRQVICLIFLFVAFGLTGCGDQGATDPQVIEEKSCPPETSFESGWSAGYPKYMNLYRFVLPNQTIGQFNTLTAPFTSTNVDCLTHSGSIRLTSLWADGPVLYMQTVKVSSGGWELSESAADSIASILRDPSADGELSYLELESVKDFLVRHPESWINYGRPFSFYTQVVTRPENMTAEDGLLLDLMIWDFNQIHP